MTAFVNEDYEAEEKDAGSSTGEGGKGVEKRCCWGSCETLRVTNIWGGGRGNLKRGTFRKSAEGSDL